jgi:hypothetical protein
MPNGGFRAKWGALMDIVSAQYEHVPNNRRPQPVVGRYKTILEVFEGLRANAQ